MRAREFIVEADEPVIYYFAYGMLTDPKFMSGAKLVGVAELKNFEYKMYQFANVEPSTGDTVFGCLWEINRKLLHSLDRMEGYPVLYDRRTYPVYVDGNKYPAEVYVMTPSTLERAEGTYPSRDYLKSVARGYINAGVPTEQIQAAMRFSANESRGHEFHTGGSLGTPYPGTYEEENNAFKYKGPRRITAMTNEALDSSYPYKGNAIFGIYTFETEDGVFYKVYLQGRDLVEVAFSAILPGEEENFRPDKITLTGTGNSRKVFGTVVKIVKEFLEQMEPKALYFTGDDSEPSRIKLYDRMIAQVDKELPNYYADKTIDLGGSKAYMLKRKEN